jgi:hypothetical protein
MVTVRDACVRALLGGCLMVAGLSGAEAADDDQSLPDPWAEEDDAFARGQPEGKNYPGFEVDPGWPKPLPNNWLIGQVGGIAVDRHDNIWILQRARSLTSDEAGALDAFVDPETGETATRPPDPEEGETDPVPISALGHDRPDGPIAECCIPAPAVMKFDQEGNLLDAWGGPADEGYLGGDQCREEDGCVWPAGEHGIFVDHNDYVYIAGNGSGNGGFPWAAEHGEDAHVLKFTSDGTHVLTVGEPGPEEDEVPDSNDTDGGLNGTPQLYNPADTEVDPKTNHLYIADGYGNHRVVVVDAEDGQYIKHWGAYGQNPVDDEASDEAGEYANDRGDEIIPYFRNPVHCVRLTHDGKVYVCDRVNDRLQVFDQKEVGEACDNPTGTEGECGFVEEKYIRADTLGPGSVWDLDTSSDKRQSCLYNADGTNQHVDTLDRQTLEILATFGRSGRYAGEFHWVHNLAIDSEGNLYTAEVDTGKRAQKFEIVGLQACSAKGGDYGKQNG